MAFNLQLDAFNFDEGQGATEDPLLAGVLMMPIEAQIHEVSLSLIRHHLIKVLGSANTVLKEFEAVYPRTASSITNKKVLWKLMGISVSSKKYDDSVSILQNLTRKESTASAVACQFLRRSCEDSNIIASVTKALKVFDILSEKALGEELSLDLSPKRSFLEMLVEYSLASGSQQLQDTYSSAKPFAFDHGSNELEVNGVRIGETSSCSTFVSKLSDFDFDKEIVLGRGAGGSVVKVLHKPSGKYMAVKRIVLDNDNMQQVMSELSIVWGIADEEGNIKRRPESPFLIQCFGVLYSQCNLFIIMEVMDGSLKDLIVPQGVPEKTCRAIALQILNGLVYMHETLFQLHRDIKPHNVLFRKSDGAVKLSDFGISSTVLESMNLNKKSTFCGTLRYMSPLAVENTEYGFEADLWSFGITLIHLALGNLPYNGSTLFEVVALKNVPPRLPEDGRFSPLFQSFITELCDPSGKPPSSSQLLRHPWFRGFSIDESKKIISEM